MLDKTLNVSACGTTNVSRGFESQMQDFFNNLMFEKRRVKRCQKANWHAFSGSNSRSQDINFREQSLLSVGNKFIVASLILIEAGPE